MDKELAIKLAQCADSDMVQTMKRANEIFKANSTDWDKPFSQQDIAYMGLIIHMQSLSDEVKDYAYISNKFLIVYNHILDITRNQELLEFQMSECKSVYTLLKKYKIEYLLNDCFSQLDILKACGDYKGKINYD